MKKIRRIGDLIQNFINLNLINYFLIFKTQLNKLMIKTTKLLLLAFLGISTINVNAQTFGIDTATFFVPTIQRMNPGRVIVMANIIVNGNSMSTYYTDGPVGIPYVSNSTIFHGNVIAFTPGTGNTNQVNLLDLRTNKQTIGSSLPYTPTQITSDAMSIFVGSSSSNQIIKIKENLTIDNNFNCKFGVSDVCIGLIYDTDVLYALITNNPKNTSSAQNRIVAISNYNGKQLGNYNVGQYNFFTVRNNKILVARTFQDIKTNSSQTTIKILNTIPNYSNNSVDTVAITQVGSDITQAFSLADLHLGDDGSGYALYYGGNLGKFNLINGQLIYTYKISAKLQQMTVPLKMFTSTTKAFIFWAENKSDANSQVVCYDLSQFESLQGNINTGKNAHAIQRIYR